MTIERQRSFLNFLYELRHVQLQYKSHFIRKLSAHNILIYQNFKVHNVHSVFWALDKFCPYVAVVPLKNVGCNKLL